MPQKKYGEAENLVIRDDDDCGVSVSNYSGSILLQSYDIRKLMKFYNDDIQFRKMTLYHHFMKSFNRLMKAISGKEPNWDITCFHEAIPYLDKYFEEHRSYHDDTHVHYVLQIMRTLVRDSDGNFTERQLAMIEMALIWHDVEYRPQNSSKYLSDTPEKSNEEMSAEIAKDVLIALGVPWDAAQKIAELIKATDHYHVMSFEVDPMKALICDIDLFRLSEDYDTFHMDREKVRREYPDISEKDWVEGSKKFATYFLSRSRIYNTPDFTHREESARNNLAKLV